ncbi:LysR family transcriptional regulator [Oricola cellulosilytica]|uniref:HTH-type transcriptional regulator CbbR n=1 Tax=Oricola cellulosilytica TaxID=1429082 RepID=A0A4R0PAR1_9HYPH|nr:LysR family transcriptional regulator [Oricola cellulosilytica]TCD13385.1 LysR family transcriptional regulator [Oricola cellulosilytica]
MRSLTLRQLRSLIAIEETGKISTAAEQLRLTGPAVTLQLKQVEEECGLRLFDRTAEGMRPTEAGKVLLQAAHAVQGELRTVEETLADLKGGKRGTLRLGAVSTAKYFAPRLIAGFQKVNPAIHIDLFIGNRSETIEALRDREIDIALMGRPPRDLTVNARVFGDHPLVIIAPPDHRLADIRDVTKEDLLSEHFLLRERGSGTRNSLEIFFADVPDKLESLGAEMGSNETIKQAVMAGLGIAFISAHTIEQELQLKKLAILDVTGMPIRRQWFAISRSDRSVTPAMEIFISFLSRRGASYLPISPKIYAAGAAELVG